MLEREKINVHEGVRSVSFRTREAFQLSPLRESASHDVLRYGLVPGEGRREIRLSDGGRRDREPLPVHFPPIAKRIEAASAFAAIAAMFIPLSGLFNWASIIFGTINGMMKTKFRYFLYKQLLLSATMAAVTLFALSTGFVPPYLAMSLAKYFMVTKLEARIASLIIAGVSFVASLVGYAIARAFQYASDHF